VIGVKGGEVSDSEEFVGDRAGTSASPSSFSLATGSNIGNEGIGARSLRSGYKCRDFNKAFSDLKYRIADRRFSTCTLASPSSDVVYIPVQQVVKPPILRPLGGPARQQGVKLP